MTDQCQPINDELRKCIARIISPKASFEDIEGVQHSQFQMDRRRIAYEKADAIIGRLLSRAEQDAKRIEDLESALRCISTPADVSKMKARIEELEKGVRLAASLKLLANLFSESVHETWTKEEIVNIIEDAIRLRSPMTSTHRNTVQAELTAKEPGELTDASGGRGKLQQVGMPTVHRGNR